MAEIKILSKITFDQNDFIFREGDPAQEVFLIQDGTVELFDIGKDGRERRLKLITAGYAFGEQVLISSDKRKYSARAMNDVTCVAVNSRRFLKQLEKEDNFIAALFRILQGNMQSVDKMGRTSQKHDLAALTEALSVTDKNEM